MTVKKIFAALTLLFLASICRADRSITSITAGNAYTYTGSTITYTAALEKGTKTDASTTTYSATNFFSAIQKFIYTAVGVPYQIILNPGGTNGSGLILMNGSSRYNWFFGSQNNVSNAFEITPSNSTGGTTFSTPLLVGTQSGDIYTADWTDYSSLSTISGWSSRTFTNIYYKKVGKTVFVLFNINGTSNATTTTFTVPYAPATGGTGFSFIASAGTAIDNGSNLTTSLTILMSGSLVNVYPNPGFGSWTNSAAKQINGQFWYQTQ